MLHISAQCIGCMHVWSAILLLHAAYFLHTRCILQDLVKRLLQKDPNARLPFSAFFSHPFLSGQPLHNIQALPEPPEIYVEEPTSSTIEGDYVILSIPPVLSTQQARGAHANDEQLNRPSHGVRLHPPACMSTAELAYSTGNIATRLVNFQQPTTLHVGRHAVQAQFEAHAAGMLSEADPVLAAHAAHLPSTLTQPQWLYVTAMCIAELAGMLSFPS